MNMTSEIKNAKEVIKGFYDAKNNWTMGKPDPKGDMARTIKQHIPNFREPLINGFDPDGKVWTEEERKEILEAPYPYEGE